MLTTKQKQDLSNDARQVINNLRLQSLAVVQNRNSSMADKARSKAIATECDAALNNLRNIERQLSNESYFNGSKTLLRA